MSEGFRQALWRPNFPLTCPNQFLHIDFDGHSQNKAGKGGGEEGEEGMTKKGTWELDVHLFFIYFYFVEDRAVAESRKTFYFSLE